MHTIVRLDEMRVQVKRPMIKAQQMSSEISSASKSVYLGDVTVSRLGQRESILNEGCSSPL